MSWPVGSGPGLYKQFVVKGSNIISKQTKPRMRPSTSPSIRIQQWKFRCQPIEYVSNTNPIDTLPNSLDIRDIRETIKIFKFQAVIQDRDKDESLVLEPKSRCMVVGNYSSEVIE